MSLVMIVKGNPVQAREEATSRFKVEVSEAEVTRYVECCEESHVVLSGAVLDRTGLNYAELHALLNEWLIEPPRTAPFPAGALLYYSIQRDFASTEEGS